jgi:broad specificity phosphatase PhoE
LRDGCPVGEGPEDRGRRADMLLGDLSAGTGTAALFAHSVILRVVAARFLGLSPDSARMFMLAPGALSILGHDHVDDSRAIASWNDRQHLSGQNGFA